MEQNFYTENFEKLLKEKSDEFRMYPSKRVWHSIYNDLHPSRKWPSVAMSMLLIIALLLIGYLNTNDNSTKTMTYRSQDTQTGVSDLVTHKGSPSAISIQKDNDLTDPASSIIIPAVTNNVISNFPVNQDPAFNNSNVIFSGKIGRAHV